MCYICIKYRQNKYGRAVIFDMLPGSGNTAAGFIEWL